MQKVLISEPLAEAGVEKLKVHFKVDVMTELTPEQLIAAIRRTTRSSCARRRR